MLAVRITPTPFVPSPPPLLPPPLLPPDPLLTDVGLLDHADVIRAIADRQRHVAVALHQRRHLCVKKSGKSVS